MIGYLPNFGSLRVSAFRPPLPLFLYNVHIFNDHDVLVGTKCNSNLPLSLDPL